MPAYITLGPNDPAQSHAFYDAVLKPIRWSAHP